jgi:hypothetical protein
MIKRKTLVEHQIVWLLHGGSLPLPGMVLDHINRDRTDNRIENLRVVTNPVSNRNKGIDRRSRSGVTGVSPTKDGAWKVKIGSQHLGTFKHFADAVEVRASADLRAGSWQ